MKTYNITMHQSRRREEWALPKNHCGLVMVSVGLTGSSPMARTQRETRNDDKACRFRV